MQQLKLRDTLAELRVLFPHDNTHVTRFFAAALINEGKKLEAIEMAVEAEKAGDAANAGKFLNEAAGFEEKADAYLEKAIAQEEAA